ncbi:hypothetical protein TNCT1_01710 [Streptomyces sp. 1-11]|nr:hypothetical protein TNCT1_01710 [Streptomyces sp. 1-11]
MTAARSSAIVSTSAVVADRSDQSAAHAGACASTTSAVSAVPVPRPLAVVPVFMAGVSQPPRAKLSV